jgi:RNA polymerase sigma-70 factor (ECF subfamily)
VKKTDEELIHNFLQGEREAIGELLERYQRTIYFLCLRMTSDHEDALELVQKTFVQVMEKVVSLQKTAAFKTWLYRIALNLCYNQLRERNIYTRALNSLTPAYPTKTYFSDPVEQEEQKSIIQDSLESLSDKQRTAVILRIYHDLSYQEIGEVLGCQESTVRSHFHLGLKKLAVKLKNFASE